ncbi:uncharacterized protein N7511_006052 [Penicillium nucicola]|uniref:uncharacterized protein n=1 Tax=Penicillium nucicola TaxID=1850975 RepID=UPI0025457778|nr:uncharacterized protein N7511_006052 [Penicillium nucicola]KAJ5757358.1 hypothetical protein N7511_006052 [Penicillium nucicola]
MESTQSYLPISPGSALVALVTVVFLLRRVWPRLYEQKKNSKLAVPIENDQRSDLAVSKEPEVPEGWWSDLDVFELERRALFSQSWIYLAHISQFNKAGAYQSFDLAGYPLFLIRGKDDKIRAFHNVCRHRAYTITRKESGASTVLGCRYHGWSYDTTGRLVKAPQFDDVPGFDKSQNSLFEIQVLTTDYGMVFVNLNAGEPEPFDETTAVTSAAFSRISGLKVNSIWAVRSLMQKSTRMEKSLFPITFLCSFEHIGLCLVLSILPVSEAKSSIRYDLFASSTANKTENEAMSNTLREVTKKLIREIEDHYQAVLANQGLVSHHHR